MVRVLKKECDKLDVENNLLYRTVRFSDQRTRKQLVLPRKCHDQSGHLEFDKTYALVRDRFFWPHMKLDVEKYYKTCEHCVRRKTLPQRAAKLSHIHSSGPLDLVCIDFLTIEPDSRNVCNVLVVTNHFTHYTQAYSTKDQKALTVAKTMCEKYFIHYGLPIHTNSR